jgi:four helix bundle protein
MRHSVRLLTEGSEKSSGIELNKFFNLAVGSANETLAVVDILRDNEVIREGEFRIIYNKLLSISKQLGGFKRVLHSKKL